MNILQKILIGFVTVEHFFILFIEMFAWDTFGKKIFKDAFPNELFLQTKVMAANQGLYNGFLAAGLLWTFFIVNKKWQYKLLIFFLSCIIIAGIYGSLTIVSKIVFTQALPATLSLIVVVINFRKNSLNKSE